VAQVKQQILRHGIYNAAAGAIRIVLALLTVPLLLRFLGLQEYGLWALVSAVLGLVALAEGGLSTASTVLISQDIVKADRQSLSETLSASFLLILGLATATAIILNLSASTIVHYCFNLPIVQAANATIALQLAGWVVWTRLIQQVLISVEQAYQRYGLLNVINTVQWIALSVGLFIVAWQGGQTIALMQWQLCAGIITLISHGWIVGTILRPQGVGYCWNQQKAIALAQQSWMTWVTTLGGALFIRGDRIIIGAQLGTEVLGVYSAITDMTGAINLFSALPVQPLLPALSQVKEQPGQMTKQPIQQALRLNAAVALGMGVTLLSVAPWLLPIFLGREVSIQTVNSFQIATIVYALFSLNAVGYYALLSIAVKWSMVLSIGSGIISLIGIAIGCQYGGLIGAMIGNASYLTSCSMVIVALQKLQLRPQLLVRTLWLPILWFGVCSAIAIALPHTIIGRSLFLISSLMALSYWFITSNQIKLRHLRLAI
jgi:O-antigen/teichoic acid export membrane protein